MSNILVTGGTGFIGSSFVKYLKNKTNHKILSPNSRALDLLNTIKTKKFFEKNRVDYVIHTANHHYHERDKMSKEPKVQMINNLTMFFNLFSNHANYKRLINFGSGAEYPRKIWNEKIKEKDIGESIPNDQYGQSKYIINEFIKGRKSQKLINLRLFGVFGENDNWTYRFIPNMCAHVILKKDLIINQNAIFDFIYIEDVIKTTLRIINKKVAYFDFNLCSGKAYELVHIANEIIKISNQKDLKVKVKNSRIITRYGGNNSRIKRNGFLVNQTPLDKSIKNVFNHLLKNKRKISYKDFQIK